MFCQVTNRQNGASACWNYQKHLPHFQDWVLVFLFLFVLVFQLGVTVHVPGQVLGQIALEQKDSAPVMENARGAV